jgi:hypothetical protein
MSKTDGAFYADSPHGGGIDFHSACDMLGIANFALQRSAGPPILYSQHLPSTDSGSIQVPLGALKRLLEYPSNYPLSGQPYQEEFGTSAGTAGWPAAAPGFPPYTGSSELTVPTADPPKGVQIVSVSIAYAINSVTASAGTIGVYRNTYANGAAITQATLLAATNLTLTNATNPYLITTPIAGLPFEYTIDTEVFVDLNFTAGSGGTVDVYAVWFQVNFNYD